MKQQLIKFDPKQLEVIKEHLKEKGETTAKGKVTNQGAINEAIKISVEQINKEK